jgi:hypothetical protein
MLLKFYAHGSALVDVPGGHIAGQVPRYVGREFVPGDGTKRPAHPATERAYEIDSDTDEGRRLAHICRRDGDLLPADKETAAFCGVVFPAAEFKDGAWTKKAPVKTKETAANG